MSDQTLVQCCHNCEHWNGNRNAPRRDDHRAACRHPKRKHGTAEKPKSPYVKSSAWCALWSAAK